MIRPIAEIQFEDLVINALEANKWDVNYKFDQTFLNIPFDFKMIKSKIFALNHNISQQLAEKAILEIKKISGSAIEQNFLGLKFLKEGIKIYDDVSKLTITVNLISDDISKNHYGAIRQFKLVDHNDQKRYPDIVCFINGLPIIVVELKAPDAYERLPEAFEQNKSLKRQFPALYAFNIFDFLSNNLESKYGSITSLFKRYFNAGKWNNNTNPINQLFNKDMISKFIRIYTFFDDQRKIKYLAAAHQIAAVEATIKKMRHGDHKGGVVWHTQGSGKSVTMLMLARAIINSFKKATIILITDRNSLHKQLFNRFVNASEYLLNKPVEVQSRQDLIEKLNDKRHFGIYFTTVQKFSSQTGQLSDRDDIFILIDEAHRSQNNLEGEKTLNKETQEFITKFGFAKFMRNAFPNAILTGFTGTPLMGDKATIDIIGNYNHKYSMNDAVSDGSTVPIFYESRRVDIKLEKSQLQVMDQIQHQYAKTLNDNDVQSEAKMSALLKSIKVKAILEDPDVVFAKAQDILKHLATREHVLNGKAMIVASSRKAAFEYYRSIIKIKPERALSTILVMTHNNKDSAQQAAAIVPKYKMNQVAAEFRKSNSQYKIAIVVDMWLTGFDVPDLDVMYIDKVIKWHNLMQTIARVNRTYEKYGKTKESGLIVDYLGIWKHLSDALAQYANSNSETVDIIPNDIEKAQIKLIDQMALLENNFLPRIKSFYQLNGKEQYSFIMEKLNDVLGFNQAKKNAFILKVRSIRRLMKIAFTIIDQSLLINVKAAQVINSLLTTHNTQDDTNLQITIAQIKKALEKAVQTKDPDVVIESTKINRDINKVAELLETEAKELLENSPNVAKKLFEESINARIAQAKKFRPIFAKKVSDKLKDILNVLERDQTLEKTLDLLMFLAKEISDKMLEQPEFQDPQLQAFFTILADDGFWDAHKHSEVLKAIAKDLMGVIKENITPEFYRNSKVKNKLAVKLKAILKKKYNYPPDGGVSKILIDRIGKTIIFNSEYFIHRKEVI